MASWDSADLSIRSIGSGEMEVAPVNAEIVAGTVQDALIARADVKNGKAMRAGTAPGNGFIRAC